MSTERFSREVEILPAFYDVDPMQVVWHGNYLKYYDVARSALLTRFDYGYAEMERSGYAWPVVDVRIKYIKPVRLAQPILVRATLVEWENRLKIDYEIRDRDSGVRLNRGSTIQVAVDIATGAMCFVSPAVLFERLGVAP